MLSDDAKLCWIAALVALVLWGAIVAGMIWQLGDVRAHHPAPLTAQPARD
jgi:hypothetical protein